MARKKTTAPADKEAVADPIKATLARIRPDDQHPVAIYRGTAPEKGKVIRITLDNGLTYSGKVADVTEADGEVMVEFKDGIAPVYPNSPSRL